jgi:hypothetical protein
MPATMNCPRCQAPIQVGQPTCTVCGLALDPSSLAAFQAEQQRQGLAPGPATTPSRTRTSGWGCFGAIFELIGGIADAFN